MKLWIDDIRPAPEGWTWEKTSHDAIRRFLIVDPNDRVTEVSFDHDLGGDDTVMPVVKIIETMAYAKTMGRIVWHVHSANPVGRANIEAGMNSAERFWDEP